VKLKALPRNAASRCHSSEPSVQKSKVTSAPTGVPTPPRAKSAGAVSATKSTRATAEKTEGVRVIKKYPNRRLYDTETSTYITLAEVRQLVMKTAMFVVRDAKSNEDLTRSILLQIILEEETGGEPMFTEAVLANIIRFYGNAMQSFMGSYLEKNVQGFMDLQVKMAEKSKGLSPEMWAQVMSAQSPMMQGMMGTYVEQSKSVFTQMQEQMQKQSEQMLAALGLKR
jgi:polyhydroxyalkanoate synthesis repressor PhaR